MRATKKHKGPCIHWKCTKPLYILQGYLCFQMNIIMVSCQNRRELSDRNKLSRMLNLLATRRSVCVCAIQSNFICDSHWKRAVNARGGAWRSANAARQTRTRRVATAPPLLWFRHKHCTPLYRIIRKIDFVICNHKLSLKIRVGTAVSTICIPLQTSRIDIRTFLCLRLLATHATYTFVINVIFNWHSITITTDWVNYCKLSIIF